MPLFGIFNLHHVHIWPHIPSQQLWNPFERKQAWGLGQFTYGHDVFYVTEMDPLSGNILFSEQIEPVREAKKILKYNIV